MLVAHRGIKSTLSRQKANLAEQREALHNIIALFATGKQKKAKG
jgi:hypothetical protein